MGTSNWEEQHFKFEYDREETYFSLPMVVFDEFLNSLFDCAIFEEL